MEDRRRKCVTCQRELEADQQGSFCTARCKLVDLGKWLDGEYTIAGMDGSADPDEQDSG